MFKKILFPVDVEELQFAREALEYVVKLARVDGASVHVVSVLPGFTMPMVASYFPKDAFDKARKALEKTLRDFVAREFPEDLEVTCAIREGTPWKEIIRERMDSEHAPRIPEVTAHLIEAGGKRLRPMLTRVVT